MYPNYNIFAMKFIIILIPYNIGEKNIPTTKIVANSLKNI